jgi:SAM-dependent methyltransferase
MTARARQARRSSLPCAPRLRAAPGPHLADIGGGTGNYALALEQEGWQPLVIDRSPKMLEHAAEKGLETLSADAQRLPIADQSFDAAILVSMLHHVADPAAAIGETQRILRPNGRLAVMVYTLEDIEDLWFLAHFPSSQTWMSNTHTSLSELLALLPGAERQEIVFDDLKDASLAALASHPEKVLQERWRSQTSYFERLRQDHPDELDAGLQRLAREIASGRAPKRPGRGSVLAWRDPTERQPMSSFTAPLSARCAGQIASAGADADSPQPSRTPLLWNHPRQRPPLA